MIKETEFPISSWDRQYDSAIESYPIQLTQGESTTAQTSLQTPMTPEPEELRFKFYGTGRELFDIFIVNVFKTLMTLGVYSFWGKVNTRQYLWRQTEFADERFGYYGTGRELLIGWIKAIFLFGSLIGLQAYIPFGWQHAMAPIVATVVFYGGLAVLTPLAVIGSMRYRLSRTSWRGIRFSFRGEYRPLFGLVVRGIVLSALTLGFYYPIYHCQLQKFRVENSYLGEIGLKFDGTGKELMGAYAWTAIGSGISFFLIMSMGSMMLVPIFGALGGLIAVIIAFSLAGLVWTSYIAERRRYYWNHTAFETARFNSTVTGEELARLYAGNALLLISTLGLAMPWVKVRSARYYLDHLTLQGVVDVNAITQRVQAVATVGDELAGLMDLDGLAA